ncbi:MAG: hypothetical protein IKP86_14655 [Anaerolineaceae bacterium]|nr:hypothetical protein [Anaerolineaceae bacterium]
MEKTISLSTIAPLRTLSHIRKNHAMEHATIHLLTEYMPNVSFSGYSLWKGYWILGKAELQGVQKAAEMALARLKNGERKLAVHPGCGTNLAVTGLCTAAAAMLTTMLDSEDDSKISRFSAFTAAGIMGATLGRPLGPKIQQNLTTDANVKDLSIVSISCSTLHGTPLFFIETVLD